MPRDGDGDDEICSITDLYFRRRQLATGIVFIQNLKTGSKHQALI